MQRPHEKNVREKRGVKLLILLVDLEFLTAIRV